MKYKLNNIIKYTLVGTASIFFMNGCTATSSPGPAKAKLYVKDFKIDANDHVEVVVTKNKTVAIKKEGEKRLAAIIKKDIDHLKRYNKVTGKTNKYLVNVHITNYDEGNAFARFMIAGAGQIHVDGEILVYELPEKIKVEEFNITKTFAWGGIYGASITIQEVGEGFAEGVAETVTKQKRK